MKRSLTAMHLKKLGLKDTGRPPLTAWNEFVKRLITKHPKDLCWSGEINKKTLATPTMQQATGMGIGNWQLCQLNPNSPKTFLLQQKINIFLGLCRLADRGDNSRKFRA